VELLIIAIVLVSLVWLSLRFGYDSRSAPHAKEHEQAQLGLVWEVETTLHIAELRRDAALWRARRHASVPPVGARRPSGSFRLRRSVADGLRVLAHKLSPELVVGSYLMESPQQSVSGC
jgi:hypothetical protein